MSQYIRHLAKSIGDDGFASFNGETKVSLPSFEDLYYI